jgi:hypothetical protein
MTAARVDNNTLYRQLMNVKYDILLKKYLIRKNFSGDKKKRTKEIKKQVISMTLYVVLYWHVWYYYNSNNYNYDSYLWKETPALSGRVWNQRATERNNYAILFKVVNNKRITRSWRTASANLLRSHEKLKKKSNCNVILSTSYRRVL